MAYRIDTPGAAPRWFDEPIDAVRAAQRDVVYIAVHHVDNIVRRLYAGEAVQIESTTITCDTQMRRCDLCNGRGQFRSQYKSRSEPCLMCDGAGWTQR